MKKYIVISLSAVLLLLSACNNSITNVGSEAEITAASSITEAASTDIVTTDAAAIATIETVVNNTAVTAAPLESDKSVPVKNLMQEATPETSALIFYSYDGEKVIQRMIFDADSVEILNQLNAVEAVRHDAWTLEDITLPLYGFYIGTADGSIRVAWSNGYWIDKDGLVYQFDFDFKPLIRDYDWIDRTELADFSSFPCACYLTQDKNGWNPTLLTPAGELTPAEGITMKLNSWNEDKVTVTFANAGETEWMYGESFHLQVLLDNTWYRIPLLPENWGFNSLGYTLASGGEGEKTYSLRMYGRLPAGTYRLVAEDIAVEHIIN